MIFKNTKNIINLIRSKEYRSLLISIALVLILVFMSFIYFIQLFYEREYAKTISNNAALATAVEQYVEARIKIAEHAIDETLFFIDNTGKPFEKLDPFVLSQNLEKIRKNFGDLEIIAVINKEANVYANSYWSSREGFLKRKPVNVNDRFYFQEHKRNVNSGTIISDPQISKTLGSQVITISKRFKTSDNSFNGIVSTILNVKSFSLAFAKISNDPSLIISLMNKDRKVVSRSPYFESFIGKVISLTIPEQIALDQNYKIGSFISVSPLDNDEKIFTYRQFDNYSLAVYIGRSYSKIYSDWKKTILELISFSTILIGLLVYFLFKYLIEHSKLKEKELETINNARMSSLGVMAASVAHEINNPLTIILGKARQSIRFLKDPSPDLSLIQNSFIKIIEASERMEKIVAGIKVFSRDASRDPVAKVKLEIIFNYVLDYSRERFLVNGINLSIESVPDVYLNCREGQISQVIVNLINNSYDAVEFFDSKWVKISFAVLSDRLKIIVIDSGPGIPAALLSKIMNPLYTSKTINKGTGLGLFISKKIILEHGGELYYDSNNSNTCFVVELPLFKD